MARTAVGVDRVLPGVPGVLAPNRVERIPRIAAARRRVNDAVRAGRDGAGDRTPRPYLCECGLLGCNSLMELSLDEYQQARADPRWCAIVPEHHLAD